MHYYLATSRAQKEKQEPNGVLAHQAALAFPFVCGASRKPRKAFGFPRCPAVGAAIMILNRFDSYTNCKTSASSSFNSSIDKDGR